MINGSREMQAKSCVNRDYGIYRNGVFKLPHFLFLVHGTTISYSDILTYISEKKEMKKYSFLL